MGPTRKLAKEDIDDAFAVNVKVPFVLVAELTPVMAARGVRRLLWGEVPQGRG